MRSDARRWNRICHNKIKRFEQIHEQGIIHRDIKPENFLVGKDNISFLYVIDFGLAQEYINNGKHYLEKSVEGIVGTARYMSINAHNKKEQSRRDDLEAIGYLLLYLVRGNLPWQSNAPDKKYKDDKTGDAKIKMPIEELCKGCDSSFLDYLKYCRKLKFEEKPDYKRIRKMFLESLYSKNEELTYLYDWVIAAPPDKKPEKEEKMQP